MHGWPSILQGMPGKVRPGGSVRLRTGKSSVAGELRIDIQSMRLPLFLLNCITGKGMLGHSHYYVMMFSGIVHSVVLMFF